jgi:hypothetical protein
MGCGMGAERLARPSEPTTRIEGTQMIETNAAKIGPMNSNGELMVYHGISGCTALSM